MKYKVPVNSKFKHKKLIKFLILQFFLFVYVCHIAPKGLMQGVFVLEILLFSFIFCLHAREISQIISKGGIVRSLPILFVLFMIVAAVYLVLSYLGFADYWDVADLPFEKEYIPRHFMVVMELMLPLGLGYLLYKSDAIYNKNNFGLLMFSLLTLSLRFVGVNPLPYAALFVAALSLYAFQTNKLWLMPLTILALPSHSAYILAALFICLLVLFRKVIINKFKREMTLKVNILLMFVALLIVLFSEEVYIVISKDENSLWRLMVWENEMKSLSQTNFSGVGFGTAYVTTRIYFEVNNPNMYIDFEDGSVYERLFVVANHNSFLNMFYRMGVIGGLLFMSIYLFMMKWAVCLYSKVKVYLKPYVWWAFCGFMYQTIIILLNPGLEMMQFAMNFCLITAILIAVLLRAQKEVINERNETVL